MIQSGKTLNSSDDPNENPDFRDFNPTIARNLANIAMSTSPPISPAAQKVFEFLTINGKYTS